MSRLFSHDKLLWHLELHSLFDFLHEKKYFGTIFSACILYPLTPNSDALPAHSLNETLIDGTSGMLTVPSAHAYVLNWLRVHNKFSIPSFVRILYRSLVRLLLPRWSLNHIFYDQHLALELSQCC